GALGYLFKNVDEKELFDCIEAVHDNRHYITENKRNVLLDYERRKRNVDMGYAKINQNPLSNREVEIVKFIMQGKTNPEIADILFLSLRTVDTHRKNILSKLEINNAAALVKYASDNAPFLGLM
ncbi:response regulator transcription factor, partial [Polluticaenibacter yanchengensis]|nr:response regulator transcription factor [Chitinophagaceae bacterium LY-5]